MRPPVPTRLGTVMEVTIRWVNGVKEPKAEYLSRIMRHGSRRARILKLADRISNVTALGFVHDAPFVTRYLEETRVSILPYAETVNVDMYRELSDLVEYRGRTLTPATVPTQSNESDHRQ